MKLQTKKLSEDAKIPTFAHETDAGLDLFAIENVSIEKNERAQIRTGISLAIPEGHVGLIWDKSGISHKGGIKVMGGVIDAGYRGEVVVGIVNLGGGPYAFEKGDKIAQILIQKIEHPEIEEVQELDSTARGEGGFGSTGK